MTMVNVPWEKTAVVVDTQKDWDEFITYIRSLGYGVTSLESTHKTLYILGVRAATVVLHQPPEIIAMAAVGQADVVLSSKPLLDKLAWLRATIGDPS